MTGYNEGYDGVYLDELENIAMGMPEGSDWRRDHILYVVGKLKKKHQVLKAWWEVRGGEPKEASEMEAMIESDIVQLERA